MPLYKISQSYKEIVEQIEECEDFSDEHKALLDSIGTDLKDKAINIGSLVQNLEAEANAIDEAVKKMQDRQSRLMNKILSLKDYLKHNLESCAVKEIKSPEFDIRIKTNPPSVVINNESEIPEQYYKETVTKRIDKLSISQQLKNNIFIPGATLETRTRIEIR